jgi:hypothetical protein
MEEHQKLGAGHTSLDVLGYGERLVERKRSQEVTLEAYDGELAGAAGGKFSHMLTIIESSDPLRDGLISRRYSGGGIGASRLTMALLR